jgi:hypothetical protein
MARKTWEEKFHNGREPEVAIMHRKVGGALPGMKMLIPTPAQVDAEIRNIPKGEKRSLAEIRSSLAAAAGADITCPMCGSLFARIVAERAAEQVTNGAPFDEVAPFWRVTDPKLISRYSFDWSLFQNLT